MASDEGDASQPILDAPRPAPRGPHPKKKRFRPSELHRIDVHERRVRFARFIKNADASRLIFLDESGCHLAMSPSHGWAPRGAPAYDYRPTNWGKNITAIAAIRLDGVVCNESFAGAMNTPRFVEFIGTRLCPRLRDGDVVVLDNLLPHKAPAVRELVEATGARLLFLPPYSPDMNPIECLWSFVKHRLRQLKQRAVPLLQRALARIVRRVPLRHLAQWFSHCGYNQRK